MSFRNTGYLAGRLVGSAIGNRQAKKAEEQRILAELDHHEREFESILNDLMNQYDSGMINHERYVYLITQAKQEYDRLLDSYEL